jgi:tetratricopeptide (TPR) repeat protein/energy-coupling factor transporter ATP-binding protein EcfA2
MNQQPVTPHEAPIHSRDRLPVRPPDELFGRDSDLATVHLALKAGTAVLLHGPAGVGKTALAAALASDYAEQPGGVIWLDVNNDSALSLLTRITRAYAPDNLTDEPDLGTLSATVHDLLRQNCPLIVLDGHIRVEATREFIRQCASGIPLLLAHSQLVAGSWTPHAVRFLPPDAAEAMLCGLAGISPDAADVSTLSEALSGHALSIFMAAHQLRSRNMQPGEFLAQMPDMPPGEANRIMGMLMTSYRLLPKDLQGIVLLLGTAFAGGASEELLADASGASTDAIRTRMRQLVSRGFAAERSVYGQPYFVTHELVQVFARTFLRGKKQLDAMQTRHLNALLAYIRRQVPAQHDRLAAEMSNVMAVGIFAAENGQTHVLDEIVTLLEAGDFAMAQGFQAEIGWLRQLVEQPDMAQAGVLGEAPEPPAPVMVEAGPEADVAGAPITEAAVEPAPEEPVEEPEIAPAQAAAAPVAAPPPPEMPELPSEPPVAPETTGWPVSPAVALPTDAESLARIGREAITQGDTAETIARYTEALEGYKADNNVEDELAALEALAMLNLESENYEAVLAYVDQGTTLAQEIDNPQREAQLLIILGDLQVTLGRWEGAEIAYQEAINALKNTNAQLDMGLTLDKLGVLYLEKDQPQDAISTWEQAIPILERAERPDLVRTVYSRLGAAHGEMMGWDQAQASYNHALELAQAAHDDQAVFEQLDNLGTMLEASGRRDEALLYYRRALHFAFDLDDQAQLGQTLLALARLLIDDTAQLHRAAQVLEAAQDCLPDDMQAQRLLGRVKTRQNRLLQAGVTLPLAEDSLQDYARAALEAG